MVYQLLRFLSILYELEHYFAYVETVFMQFIGILKSSSFMGPHRQLIFTGLCVLVFFLASSMFSFLLTGVRVNLETTVITSLLAVHGEHCASSPYTQYTPKSLHTIQTIYSQFSEKSKSNITNHSYSSSYLLLHTPKRLAMV